MSVKIQEVIDALELFAPLPLQESYDNAGLQVGLTEADCSGALLCLDVTEDVVEEAARRGCNLIVAHHPLLFHGLRQVSDRDYIQRTVVKAIRLGITIAAMHTNIDNAEGGVNYRIADILGLTDVRFLTAERTIAMGGVKGGSGVIGSLPQPMAAVAFIKEVKRRFHAATAMTNAPLTRPIRRVALCGGAGAEFLADAVKAGADAYITGEMHYHDYFGHDDELQIIVLGHYETEQYTPQIFRAVIAARFPQLPLHDYGSTNPIHYF